MTAIPTDRTEAKDASPVLKPGEWRATLAGLLIVLALSSLDQNILNTAMPRIAADLGASKWIWLAVSAFLVTSTVSTPLYGKIADRHGVRPTLCVSVLIFAVASAACGLSQDVMQLVGWRAVQGLGAGGLGALAQSSIGELVGPDRRARYQGLFTAIFAGSALAGPMIGGALTLHLSWRWVFYINLPLSVLATVLLLRAPRTPRRAAPASARMDLLGVGWLTVAMVGLMTWLAMAGAGASGSPAAVALLAASVGAGAVFLRREKRAASPFLDLDLLRSRSFRAAAWIGAWLGFATVAVGLYGPLYFQTVYGMDPVQAGLMLVPKIVMMLLAATVSSRWITPNALVPVIRMGLALEVVAVALMAAAAWGGWPPAVFQIALGIMGAGMGVAWPNVITLTQNRVPRARLATATSLLLFGRSAGGALGVAVAGAALAAGGAFEGLSRGPLVLVFALLTGGMAAAFVGGLLLPVVTSDRPLVEMSAGRQ